MDGTKTMIIGLTGQTGAGKSTLSGMFAERSVAVINADAVARDTMEHSKSCLMDLVLAFSTEVIHPDATLNREKLAEIWQLVSMTPQEFKDGGIWNIVEQINGALQAIGYGLLVLFSPWGCSKTR